MQCGKPLRIALEIRPHHVLVGFAHHLFQRFHHGHLRPQGAEHRSELQTQNATPDHQQALRNFLQVQGRRGVQDAWIVRKQLKLDRPGTCSDDRLRETYFLSPLPGLDRQRMCGHKLSPAGDHFDFAALGKRAEAVGQLCHASLLPISQCVQINPRWVEHHSPVPPFGRILDQASRMQQSLGRDTADVQAYAAESRETFHQHYLHA